MGLPLVHQYTKRIGGGRKDGTWEAGHTTLSSYTTAYSFQTARCLFQLVRSNMSGLDLTVLLPNGTAPSAQGVNTTQLIAALDRYAADVDSLWQLLAAFMVFGMQIGFVLVEAGNVRANLRSILMKNVFDICLSALSWWMVGYGIAKVLPNACASLCVCALRCVFVCLAVCPHMPEPMFVPINIRLVTARDPLPNCCVRLSECLTHPPAHTCLTHPPTYTDFSPPPPPNGCLNLHSTSTKSVYFHGLNKLPGRFSPRSALGIRVVACDRVRGG